jgi:SagB-type dehydrogenase family enzyme
VFRMKETRKVGFEVTAYRKFLKSDLWDEWEQIETDQRRGIPPPSPQKPYPKNAKLVALVSPENLTIGKMPLIETIGRRRSRRRYSGEALSFDELSFLVWATQGVSMTAKRAVSKNSSAPSVTVALRTVPSAGARHPFETYLLVNRVDELEPGLYRYLPLENKLCFLRADTELTERVHEACYKQYARDSAVTFIWTAVPYRTEWRYSILSPKLIAQDSGHLCQNLYLACEAICCGTCAIGAYDQEKMDAVLMVDGQDEFAVYVATVGKIESKVS